MYHISEHWSVSAEIVSEGDHALSHFAYCSVGYSSKELHRIQLNASGNFFKSCKIRLLNNVQYFKDSCLINNLPLNVYHMCEALYIYSL